MPTFKNRILGANPNSPELSLDSDILLGCLLDAIGYCRVMFPEQIFKRASRNNYHHLSRNEIGGAKRISPHLSGTDSSRPVCQTSFRLKGNVATDRRLILIGLGFGIE